jgi:hypothetical protein
MRSTAVSAIVALVLISVQAIAQTPLPFVSGSSTSVTVPVLVQHTVWPANPAGIGESGNAFVIPIPNPVGAGNCLILAFTYPSGSAVRSITDTNGNSWSTTPDKSVTGSSYISAVFVLPNAIAGQDTITVTFNAAVIPYQVSVSEFNGIATTSPVNGSSSAANQTGASLSTGSFTPGNNDTNGGNLIFNYYALSAAASGAPTKWVSGGSFSLLDADIGWTSNQGFPHATQYYLQTTSAAINPGITATGDTSDSYNCVAVALKVADAGTAKPSDIHIDKILHITPLSASTVTFQLPASGNLRVVTATNIALTITGVTDSDGATWTNANPGGTPMYVSVNRSPNPALILTVSLTGSGVGTTNSSFRLYDVSGAASSPLGTVVNYPDTGYSGSTLANAPTITPSVSGSLVIAYLGLGIGPVYSVTSPVGAVFDIMTYTGETDGSLTDNADGVAHLYNSGTSALNFDWTMVNTANSAFGAAVAFKSLVGPLTSTHDFNGDGRSDIAWRDASGDLALWLMNGTTVLSSGGFGGVPATWSIVGQRDFNGDGTADLLWRDTSGDTAMWFMNGTSVASTASVGNIPTNWSVVGVADFNGDGIGDLLWRDTSGDIAVWLMSSATVMSSAALGNVPTTWTVVGTGDFNGDGMSDILWRDNQGNTSIWFMNGTAVASAAGVGNIPTNWSVVGTGDFNGDGMTDIVWRDTAGDTSIWLMNGAAVVSAVGLGNVPTTFSIALVGDFNGDGMSDLLWQDNVGDTSIWFMNGTTLASTGSLGNIPTTWTVQSLNAE